MKVFISVAASFDLSESHGKIRSQKVGAATIVYEVTDGRVNLQSLRVPQNKRRSGEAKNAMRLFLSDVDEKGLEVKLGASALDKKTNTNKLVGFYKSLGFILTGRSINMLGDPEMLRPTQRSHI